VEGFTEYSGSSEEANILIVWGPIHILQEAVEVEERAVLYLTE